MKRPAQSRWRRRHALPFDDAVSDIPSVYLSWQIRAVNSQKRWRGLIFSDRLFANSFQLKPIFLVNFHAGGLFGVAHPGFLFHILGVIQTREDAPCFGKLLFRAWRFFVLQRGACGEAFRIGSPSIWAKRLCVVEYRRCGAGGGTLTRTGLPLPDFEFSVSFLRQPLSSNTPQKHSIFDLLAV